MGDGWPLEIDVRAISAGREVDCHLVANALKPHVAYELSASFGSSDVTKVTSSDLFGALLELRRELDMRGIRLCCAGSRQDVWASGMQRDMGQGLRAYVLTLPRRRERPASVGIFDPIAPEVAVSVAEQEQFYKNWLESPPAS